MEGSAGDARSSAGSALWLEEGSAMSPASISLSASSKLSKLRAPSQGPAPAPACKACWNGAGCMLPSVTMMRKTRPPGLNEALYRRVPRRQKTRVRHSSRLFPVCRRAIGLGFLSCCRCCWCWLFAAGQIYPVWCLSSPLPSQLSGTGKRPSTPARSSSWCASCFRASAAYFVTGEVEITTRGWGCRPNKIIREAPCA